MVIFLVTQKPLYVLGALCRIWRRGNGYRYGINGIKERVKKRKEMFVEVDAWKRVVGEWEMLRAFLLTETGEVIPRDFRPRAWREALQKGVYGPLFSA